MTISEARLKELIRTEKKLNALEAGGVENWEYYENSLWQFAHWQEMTKNI